MIKAMPPTILEGIDEWIEKGMKSKKSQICNCPVIKKTKKVKNFDWSEMKKKKRGKNFSKNFHHKTYFLSHLKLCRLKTFQPKFSP